MALVEPLDNLPMTVLETSLQECLHTRGDIAGRILSSLELSEYVTWMVRTYGQTHGKVTQEMLPFFTRAGGMTSLAAQVAASPDKEQVLSRLSGILALHEEEDYIAPGVDISVGRMLRFFPGHWHATTYFTVYYAFSGECPVHFQNEVVILRRGSVLIVAPGVLHATPCQAEDAVLSFFMMRSKTFQSVFWSQLGEDNLLSRFFRLALRTDQATSYLFFETNEDPEVRHLLLQVYQEYQEDKMYAPQMILSLMRLFFLLLLRRYEGTVLLPQRSSFFWKSSFSAILSYIQTHFQETSLKEVAERFHYSTKQVGRIVQDCTGQSFTDLIRSLKLKKAGELLLDRNLPPEEAAALVGYSSINSFYRSFKEFYGLPPVEWLRREQEQRQREAEDNTAH